MATSAAKNIGTAVKTVAPVVGKKLMKIGMRSLKDWAQQKQLNEAIQSNLRQVANETADDYLEPQPAAQAGNGRRRRKRRHTLVAVRGRKTQIRDCFSKRPRL
jgi:adenylosuccinate synthase